MTSVDHKKPYASPGHENLGSPSFLGLLLTQWLTIVNDNTFRWLVVGIGKEYVSPDKHNMILTLGLALFVLPYLTLASPAGYLADRFSKRQVIVICKLAEIVVMLLGVWAIYLGSLPFLFLVVAMMGAQSALFAPSKMGQLPEMLPPHRISAANGWFALATFTATIVGMWIGGGLADITRPRGQGQLWVSAAVLIGVAVVGTCSSLLIHAYQPANSTRRFPFKPHVESWRDLKLLVGNRALLLVMLGIVFFWSIGAISQLNIDQFAYESGTFFESERTPLLISMVFGVGLGSVLAGSISRGRIELGMLAYALFFQAIFATLLATLTDPFFNIGKPWNMSLFLAMVFLMSMGASAGLFNVPLASYIQHRSPPEQRGSILSATNLCVFAGIFVSAGIYLLLRVPMTPGNQDKALVEFRATLSETEVAESKQVASAFVEAWTQNPESPPSVREFLGDVAPRQQPHTLGLMVWEDLSRRRAQGENPAQLKYYIEFRDPRQRQVIKSVFLQSNRLPMLTSHQVFLFVGCVTFPVALITFLLLPQVTLRFPLVLAFHARGRIHIQDSSTWNHSQPALLAANACSSWARFVLHLTSPCRVIEIRWESPPASRWERWWAEFWGVVWVTEQTMAQGNVGACLQTHFKRGAAIALFDPTDCDKKMSLWRTCVEKMGSELDVQVIPVFLEDDSDPVNADRAIWSRLFSTKKTRVTVHFGESREVDLEDHQSFRAWFKQ